MHLRSISLAAGVKVLTISSKAPNLIQPIADGQLE
jgi:hypothetical protein